MILIPSLCSAATNTYQKKKEKKSQIEATPLQKPQRAIEVEKGKENSYSLQFSTLQSTIELVLLSDGILIAR